MVDATQGNDVAIVDEKLVKDMDELGRYVQDSAE